MTKTQKKKRKWWMFRLDAMYDPMSDKILNCEPNTIEYYHEEGHQKSYKAGLEPFINMISAYCLLISVAAYIGLGRNDWNIKLLALFPIFGILLNETYAWIFAIRKLIRTRKERGQ